MADENVVDWKSGLSPEQKAVVEAKGWKGPADVVSSYHSLEGTLGNSMRIPGPDASDAARKEFQEKLLKAAPSLVEVPTEEEKAIPALRAAGRLPKEAKEYSLDGIEFAAGTAPSTEELAALQAEAFESGLTKKAFRTLISKQAAARKAALESLTANEAALKQEFGQAFDDEMKGLRILAEKTGAPDDVKKAIESKTITKAQVAWLKNVGKALGHDTRELATQGNNPTPRITPAEAKLRQQEALALANDMSKPAEVRSDAYKRAFELQAVITPEAVG